MPQNYTYTHKNKFKGNQKIWLKLFACFLQPTHRSSYGFLFLFPFVSLILLSRHFYDFSPFFYLSLMLQKNYDCFSDTYICQYLFMYMRFPFIENLFFCKQLHWTILINELPLFIQYDSNYSFSSLDCFYGFFLYFP